ncbi:MAG: Ig-like domain-containing protein, partial [Opitutales bacterium]
MIQAGNGRLVAFHRTSGTVYSTTDGANWTEVSLFSDPDYCHFVDGFFYVDFNTHVYRSVDGISWDYLGTGGLNGFMVVQNGTTYLVDGLGFRPTTSIPDWSSREPFLGGSAPGITAVIADETRVVVAGLGGLLVSAPSLEELNFENFKSVDSSLHRIISTDHGFYAFWKQSFRGRMYYSADGSQWEEIETSGSDDYSIGDIHYANGLFWAKSSNQDSSGDQFLYKGTHPASLEPQINAQQGNLVDIVYANERYYMIQQDPGHVNTSPAKLYESADGENWMHVSAISVSQYDRLYAFDGRVFVSSYSRVSVSSDGNTWETLQLIGGFGYQNAVFADDGKIYVFDSYGNFHTSVDGGSSWNSEDTNLNFHTVPNLNKIGEQFAIVSGTGVYLSDDGVTWGYVSHNGRFNDVAFGLGTIVGVGDSGIIMQSGAPASTAPVCEIISPAENSTVSQSSEIPVNLTAFDPEGRFESIRCYWNNELVYQSATEGEHEFTVFARELGSGTLRVVVEDEDQMRTNAVVQVSVLKSQRPLWSAPYSPYDVVGSSQVGGDVYLFTRDGITLRSHDGINWEALQLPLVNFHPTHIPTVTRSVAAGDELVILATNDGALFTSSDGQNWTVSKLERSNLNLRHEIQYNDGIFAVPYSYSSNITIAFSRNGYDWIESGLIGLGSTADIVLGHSGLGLLMQNASYGDTLYAFTLTREGEVALSNTGLRRAVSAVWGSGRFVAVLTDGSIRTSVDLETWTQATWSGATPDQVVFAGDRFFLMDNDDILATSDDGLSWHTAAGTYVNGLPLSDDLLEWSAPDNLRNTPLNIENLIEGNGIWIANHSLYQSGVAWSEDEGRTWHAPDFGSIRSVSSVG